MRLNWTKCQGEVWCKLNFVNLLHEHFSNLSGVYMIWHGGPDAHVVYIGKGNIRERLQDHRSDQAIQRFQADDLYVTWARVPNDSQDGVEAYLAEMWSPKIGERHPNVPSIPVNSPWE